MIAYLLRRPASGQVPGDRFHSLVASLELQLKHSICVKITTVYHMQPLELYNSFLKWRN